jgi:hypothetical protein
MPNSLNLLSGLLSISFRPTENDHHILLVGLGRFV